MMQRRWLALILALGLVAACGGEGEPAADSAASGEAGDPTSGAAGGAASGLASEYADALDVRLDAMNETDAGLRWRTLQEGDGASAEAGDTVRVHYTGWLPDGTKFDSSRDRGQPFEFALGQGQVIQGWDRGVAGMQVGETRQLVIPPSLGYGQRGAGNVIPPGATLVFQVELLEVR